MSLLMIHEAYMPVYRGSRFSLQAGRFTRGSTRGPRRPKKCVQAKFCSVIIDFSTLKGIKQYALQVKCWPLGSCKTKQWNIWILNFKFESFAVVSNLRLILRAGGLLDTLARVKRSRRSLLSIMLQPYHHCHFYLHWSSSSSSSVLVSSSSMPGVNSAVGTTFNSITEGGEH